MWLVIDGPGTYRLGWPSKVSAVGSIRRMLCVVIAAGTSGCTSVTIQDLQLASLQLVERKDQAELAHGGAEIISQMAGDPNLMRRDDLRTILPEAPNERLLKTQFTSEHDLSKIDFADNLH